MNVEQTKFNVFTGRTMVIYEYAYNTKDLLENITPKLGLKISTGFGQKLGLSLDQAHELLELLTYVFASSEYQPSVPEPTEPAPINDV